MIKKTKFKLTVWAVCLLAGSSVLFAQWLVTSPAEEPIETEQQIVDRILDAPLVISPSHSKIAAWSRPSPAAAPVAKVALDTRLVARLLVDSVTQVESSGNPRMVGRHGERGLMQIKAGAWGDVTRALFGRRISFDRAFEGKLNQQVGSAYLAQLQGFLGRHQRLWKADERSLLLACYNAGPERVKSAGFDLRRLPAHTQDYVKRASALHDALLADHNVDPARVRLALTEQHSLSGGT